MEASHCANLISLHLPPDAPSPCRQLPEGSAGQELILEQEDGQQVVLQVPHGAAGPDGVIRLIQVTAEDGTVQYIASSAGQSPQIAASA